MKKTEKKAQTKKTLVNLPKSLINKSLRLPAASLKLVKQTPQKSLNLIKKLPSSFVDTSKVILGEMNSGLLVVLIVAIVAVTGLAINFNQTGITGSVQSRISNFDMPPKLISDEGGFVYQGRLLFDECYLRPEKMEGKFKKAYPDQTFSQNECCSLSCQDFCPGKDSNCYGLCRMGCETENEILSTKK